jgi:formylglycine-generating enzyme required for sulfatase activity
MRSGILSILVVVFCMSTNPASANNIAVSNVQLVNKNTSAGPNSLENFAMVQFNLSWENAWRTSTGPSNWDAAWVFVKYRVGRIDLTLTNGVSAGTTITVASTAGLRIGMPVEVTSGVGSFGIGSVVKEILSATQFVVDRTPEYPLNGGTITAKRIWEHATLSSDPTQHSLGSFTIGGANATGAFTGVPDGTGVFVHLGQDGSGNIAASNVQLRWRYGANGLVDSNVVDLKVFAVEMVYVPQGSFYVGSGGEEPGSLTNGVWLSGKTVPFRVNSEEELGIEKVNGKLWGTSASIGPVGTLPASFPKGFDAFYCMKYEMTQKQYVDFLNTLTYEQQSLRFQFPPNSTVGNGYNYAKNNIQIKRQGVFRLDPAEYGCDLNPRWFGDDIFNQPDDGMDIPCNYLSWPDVAAYLDWSGMRPMSEIEFEKACRGSQSPVANEAAWGTSFINWFAKYTVNNWGAINESIASGYVTTPEFGNAVYDNTDNFTVGPLRVGIFAAHPSNVGDDRQKRHRSGSTYTGIMEMSGNVNEFTVGINSLEGRNYTGINGDGKLTYTGNANSAYWPGSINNEVTGLTGILRKGGNTQYNAEFLRVSTRDGISGNNDRQAYNGGRGVRSLK